MAAPDKVVPSEGDITSPASHAFAVTPSDSTDLAVKPRALWINTGGNVYVEMRDDAETGADDRVSERPERHAAPDPSAQGSQHEHHGDEHRRDLVSREPRARHTDRAASTARNLRL